MAICRTILLTGSSLPATATAIQSYNDSRAMCLALSGNASPGVSTTNRAIASVSVGLLTGSATFGALIVIGLASIGSLDMMESGQLG